jgi:hypothetical protein
LEQYGPAMGAILILLVGVVSILIGKLAAASVARFREEHHERYTGQDAE